MRNLTQFINESTDISDNEIWFRLGIARLQWMHQKDAKKFIKNNKVTKSNLRKVVIDYMKETHPALPKDSEEFIHRKDWDLDSLIGETEGQLMHKDYYKMANYILDTNKPKHDTICIMQCSSSKPYMSNPIYDNNYFSVYGDYVDFACLSNPGVIPIHYSRLYPYRYDDWNTKREPSEDILKITNMNYKYHMVCLCRILRFYKKSGYKYVIGLFNHPFENWMVETILNYNLENAESWLSVVNSEEIRDRIVKQNPGFKKNVGLLYSRLMLQPKFRKRFERLLRANLKGDELKSFNKTIQDRDEYLKSHSSKPTNESMKKPEYKMLNKLDFNGFLNKFKDSIKTNEVKKSSKNYLYKQCYWSLLDLLLLEMDGNLIEDIDKEYWEWMEKMEKEKDFVKIGGFLFAYKPLLDKYDISHEDIIKDANDLKLLPVKPSFELPDAYFE